MSASAFCAFRWIGVCLLFTLLGALPAAANKIYVSSSDSGVAGNVVFSNEDILVYDTQTHTWSKYFDGSDVGLTYANVDAFHLRPDGSILMSFEDTTWVPSVGWVSDADIVRFVPTSLGSSTAGQFEMYFDASDVGLTSETENVDAIAFAPPDAQHPQERLVISTTASIFFSRDEDLDVFNATSLGSNTQGSFEKYFDGSDVGLDLLSEDVTGAWIDPATREIYLSTRGFFSVNGASGDGDDIFICHPTSIGSNTSCQFRSFFNGAAAGFFGGHFDGIYIQLDPTDAVPPTISVSSPVNGAILSTNTPTVTVNYSDPTPGSGLNLQSFAATLNGVAVTAQVGASSATYAITSPLADGSHVFTARISDAAGNTGTASSTFTVDHTAPMLQIAAPVDGAVLSASQPTLRATYSDPSPGSGLDLTTFSATLDGAAVTAQAAAGEATYAVASPLADGLHVFRARISDRAGNSKTATSTFRVDHVPPLMTIATPSNGAILSSPPSAIRVDYSDPANGSGVDLTSFQLQVDGTTVAAQVGAASATYSVSGSLPDGTHTLIARIKDGAGNMATASSTFTVDHVPPVLQITDPVDAAILSTTQPTIRVTYSDPSSGSGLDLPTFSATLDGVAVTAQVAEGQATYAVPSPLADGSHVFTARIADRAGNSTTATSTFRVDHVPPLVAIATPSNGAILTSAPGTIRVDYNDPANGSGLDVTSFQLQVDGTTVAAQVGAASATYSISGSVPDGTHTIFAQIKDGAGNISSATSTFILDHVPPAMQIVNPAPGSTTTEGTFTVRVQYSDPTPGSGLALGTYSATLDGAPLAASQVGATEATHVIASPLANGTHVLSVQIADRAGNTATASSTFTVAVPPLAVAIASPPDLATLQSGTVIVTGSITRPQASVTVNGVSATVTASTFSAQIPISPGFNPIQAVAVLGPETRSAGIAVIRESQIQLPPDPAAIAPPIDPTAPAPVFAATQFLYTGASPVQTGVAAGAIAPNRIAVLRGTVLTRTGEPLPAVRISVLSHPELGQTYSRGDGRFDLAANGGGRVTLVYEKLGFPVAQRTVDVPWSDYVEAPEVRMVALDAAVTPVDLSSPAPMQVARGTRSTDSDGSRQATLLFPTGVTAQLVLPNGSTQPLGRMNVRTTEYTIGAAGPAAMPAQLPPTSAYTFAVELSVDEAIAAGAQEVRFSSPLPYYMENFLGIPTGTAVPVGFYDRKQGVWVSSSDGRVVRVISTAGGLATLDVTGDGIADDASTLASLGITLGEQQSVAALYAAGQSLWRVSIPHFSTCDFNFSVVFPPGFRPPFAADRADGLCEGAGLDGGPGVCPMPARQDQARNDACTKPGSTLECENQVLGETIPLVGVPAQLHYRSDRVQGHLGSYTMSLPLTRSSVDPALQRIDVDVDVAGRLFQQSFSPAANLSSSVAWDGLDVYGRAVQGSVLARAKIDYVYDLTYGNPGSRPVSFALAPSGPGLGVPARFEQGLRRRSEAALGEIPSRLDGLGGWTLSIHHAYDPLQRVLLRGDGTREEGIGPKVLRRVVGTAGVGGIAGDGGPALDALINGPLEIDFGADGSVYIADAGNARLRRIDPNGTITTITGTTQGCSGFAPDGAPAQGTCMTTLRELAVGPDGSVYTTRNLREIYRIRPNGTLQHVAGAAFGLNCLNPILIQEGALATDVPLQLPKLAAGPDGNLYFVDNGNCRKAILRVGDDGHVQVVAGNNSGGFTPDGQPARGAHLGGLEALAVGRDGSVYFLERSNTGGPAPLVTLSIRKISPDGILSTLLGPTTLGFSGDGGPAKTARIGRQDGQTTYTPQNISVDAEGNVWIPDWGNNRVRRIGVDGIITTVVGDGTGGLAEDALEAPLDVRIAPDGFPYVSQLKSIVSRVESAGPGGFVAVPGASSTDQIRIPSSDGTEVYEFSASGQHLATFSSLTGARLLSFQYDPAAQLSAIEDANGLVTRIERGVSGVPTAIIAPFGQRTDLTLDANGYLAAVRNPAGETYQMTYGTGGLLSEFRKPSGSAATTFAYDASGRLTQETDANGAHVTLTRTGSASAFRVTHRTDLGRSTAYTAETTTTDSDRRTRTSPAGLATTVLRRRDGTITTVGPEGTATTQIEEADPRLGIFAPITSALSVATPGGLLFTRSQARTAVVDPSTGILQSQQDSMLVNGRTSAVTYDGPTRTSVTTSAEGRTVRQTLDAQARLRDTQVASLEPIRRTYDVSGRLATLAQGSGAEERVARFAYDAQGNVASVTDPLGRIATFGYDAAGRPTQQVLPGGRSTIFSYDASGNLTSLTPPGQPPHLFRYTPLDQESEYEPPQVDPNDPRTIFTYDRDRNLAHVARPDGEAIDLGYDTAGRLRTVTTPRGITTQTYSPTTGQVASIAASGGQNLGFTYDGGLLRSSTWSGPVSGSVAQTYDSDFRVASQSVNGGTPVAFVYDGDGLLEQAGALTLAHDPGHGLLTGTVLGTVEASQQYNAFGEVATDSASVAGSPLYANAYTRDALGRILRKVETIQGTTTTYDYAYDPAGRLSEVQVNGAVVATYLYDANGNRLSHATAQGTATGTYDAQDRLLAYGSISYTWDGAGDLLSKTDTVTGATTQYQYDALGNLVRVDLPDGGTIEYLIDGQNRRVGKKVNGVLVKGWLYQNQLNPVAELDASGNAVSRFIYGTRPNVPDYMIRDGVMYRILTDHLGSPRLVLNASTGAIAQRIDYDEFGNPSFISGVRDFQPFGFTGGLYDVETGLLRFGARDYDTVVGRWTTKDPVGLEGDEVNLYGYVLGDPVNLVDPTGLYSALQFTLDAGNFLTGVADAASLGLGPLARDYLESNFGAGGGYVDRCSNAYTAGTYASLVLGAGRLAYAGAAKVLAAAARSGAAASAERQVLKRIFRLGLSRNPRGPARIYDTDAALRAAAGRTNPFYNALGANGAIGGGVGALNQCGCPSN